jgi:beta-glucanase (GH16 family)
MYNSSLCRSALAMLSLCCIVCSCRKEGANPDPSKPTLSVNPVSKSEGTGGTTSFAFDVTLGNTYSQPVSVQVSTVDGIATSGEDFAALNKSQVTVPAGQTKGSFTVTVVGDEWKEADEDFFVTLSNPVNCVLATENYRAYILNDDSRIRIAETGNNTSPTSYPGLSLAWADEFNGSSLDLTSWNFDKGDGCPNLCGWGNNELEFYTENENLYFQEGKMVIEARLESRGGKSYTSTRLNSQNKRSFRFGRIDIRAKVPRGRGVWPAFWMLGNNITTVGWPRCGEMDIMELLGQEPNKVYSTIHFGPGPGSIQISRSLTATAPFSDDFHLYSLVWQTDRLRFMVDNQVISEVTKADLGANNYPFNDPFYFILNVAVGGNWPGSPDATTRFPQWLMVDYIRVFQ